MGYNHARIFNEISTLIGVSDQDEERGRKVANKFGVKWFYDYKEMLAKVDAVSIAVPTSLHLNISEFVISSGTHLLVEKPLADNFENASEINDLAKKKNLVLAVGHIERHNPVITYVKDRIKNGNLGKVLSLSSVRASPFPTRINDVGVLFDLCIHDFDIFNSFANSLPRYLYCSGSSTKSVHEDNISGILKYESDLQCSFSANWLTPARFRKLNVTTDNYHFELDYQNQEVISHKLTDGSANSSSSGVVFVSKREEITKSEPLKLELNDFLSSIVQERNPLVTGDDGVKAVSLSEKSLKSYNSNEVLFF